MKLPMLQCTNQYAQFRVMFLWEEKIRIIYSEVSVLNS